MTRTKVRWRLLGCPTEITLTLNQSGSVREGFLMNCFSDLGAQMISIGKAKNPDKNRWVGARSCHVFQARLKIMTFSLRELEAHKEV